MAIRITRAPGIAAVLATAETLAVMRARLGDWGESRQALDWHQPVTLGDVRVWLAPAGHVFGSCPGRDGVSRVPRCGKRRLQTYRRFRPVRRSSRWPCDVFVTEATFALPVFVHPPPAHEIQRLLDSVALFPDRTHVVGCYALGKCQRLIALLRQAGWDRPIWLHGALASMCEVYRAHGVPLGDLRPATVAAKAELVGAIVLAPPSAIRRTAGLGAWKIRWWALASGWMRVRQRAKSRGVELPLVISDHADWNELNHNAG